MPEPIKNVGQETNTKFKGSIGNRKRVILIKELAFFETKYTISHLAVLVIQQAS